MAKLAPIMPTVVLAAVTCLSLAIVSASGASPVTITITADNHYDLYVNGVLVGSQNNSDGRYGWDMPETWIIDMSPGVGSIAVAAQDESDNSGSGIGLIASIVVEGGGTYVTDPSWRVAATGPSGWEARTFDDSAWSAPLDEGPFNSIPWSLYAPPISAFASSGARWLWRGSPPYASGYGYYNGGGFQFCYFRKYIVVPSTTPTRAVTWGLIKTLAQHGETRLRP